MGREALNSNESIPLKTMLIHRARVCDDVELVELPGGDPLLTAFRAGRITAAMEDAALEKHFRSLHEKSLDKAAEAGLRIEIVAFSCPNFMRDECKRGFDRYIEHIVRLFRPI